MILLESTRYSDQGARLFYVPAPDSIIQCYTTSDVIPLLEELERAVANGYFAAGFLGYEAGFALLPQMPSYSSSHLPLAWFGLSRVPQQARNIEDLPAFLEQSAVSVEDLSLGMGPEEYDRRIRNIKREIETGYTYQVNFTMRYTGRLRGSSRNLYRQLRRKQSVSYAAYIETDDWAILSLSPELFFHKRDRDIWMRPMKGTAPRGRTLKEDAVCAARLQESEKERSENLMIVDMLRSDLGKICETGTVSVTDPLRIERYETLLQMTSEIYGRLKQGVSASDIFHAAFPCGSVTGAPKVRTMQIIREQETSPRKIYTGSIGFLHGTEAVFSVAIRTAVCDLRTGALEMGVGSGILFEADSAREYEECKLKAAFLREPPMDFQLLETMLWDPASGYRLLDFHLDRLIASAEYFLFPVLREDVHRILEAQSPQSTTPHRVRLLLDVKGNVKIESFPLEPLSGVQRVRLAKVQTNSADRFLYHKTTLRPVYNREWEAARQEGYFDVLFFNEREELTEGAIFNVFVVKNGTYYTPPVSCGLLAGTFRRHLLETKPFAIEERMLLKRDLLNADAIYLANAVRGLVACALNLTA